MSPAGHSRKSLMSLTFLGTIAVVLWALTAPQAAAEPALRAPVYAPQLTATPTTTVTPQPTGVFSVTVAVLPAATQVASGELLTVTVQIDNHSSGCQYPVYDLTLSQANTAIFTPITPLVVGPPVDAVTVYTLTASLPGSVRFHASAYGERNCGDFWQWHYVNGVSVPVTVTGEAQSSFLPLISRE